MSKLSLPKISKFYNLKTFENYRFKQEFTKPPKKYSQNESIKVNSFLYNLAKYKYHYKNQSKDFVILSASVTFFNGIHYSSSTCTHFTKIFSIHLIKKFSKKNYKTVFR